MQRTVTIVIEASNDESLAQVYDALANACINVANSSEDENAHVFMLSDLTQNRR